MTNKQFSEDNFFVACCKAACNLGQGKIHPTVRQASKFRMKKGLAYKARRNIPKQDATEGVK